MKTTKKPETHYYAPMPLEYYTLKELQEAIDMILERKALLASEELKSLKNKGK
jgi:hypothetical protein